MSSSAGPAPPIPPKEDVAPLEKKSIKPYLMFCILSCTLTAFSFGFHSGVINQPREAMSHCAEISENCIPMNDLEWGIFVSLFVVGGIFGGASGGTFATRLGRKSTLFCNNLLFAFGTALIFFGSDFYTLSTGRLLIGFAAGIGTVVVPLYIAELAPLNQRGSLGSLNQLSIVCGVLISVIIGIPLSVPDLWRWLFGFALGMARRVPRL